MDGMEVALLAKANEQCQDPAFRNAVWRHLGYRGDTVGPRELNTRIHPNDQMLQHSLRHFREVNRSVSQYFNVALQQHNAAQQAFRLVLGAPSADHRLLDFACGYGRLLRFLTLSVPRTQIWASEIQADAVDFAVGQFGVHGILSDIDPQRFEPGIQFDFIWVASPSPCRATSTMAGAPDVDPKPGGIVCFSVHDECLLPSHIAMPPDGIHFISSSENAELDGNAYGTTFVSEAFVRSAIAGACGAHHPYFRIRRGLANEQDLYVVPRAQDCDLGRLTGFRKGAWGWVDECRVSGRGALPARLGRLRDDGRSIRSRSWSTGRPIAARLGSLATTAHGAGRRGSGRRLGIPALSRRRAASASSGDRASARRAVALLYAGPLLRPIARSPMRRRDRSGNGCARALDALLEMIRRRNCTDLDPVCNQSRAAARPRWREPHRCPPCATASRPTRSRARHRQPHGACASI
jgi:SAM-dependent methyltransferase